MELVTVVLLFLKTYFLFPLNLFFWVVVFLIALQYRRLARTETQLFGRPKYSIWQQTFFSSLFGLTGGLFASMLLLLSGISLLEIGIIYVWPLAVLLLLVHPRYLCFAYAGGLIGALSASLQLLGGHWPVLVSGPLAGLAAIHVPGLLALIGILHLTESFLIAMSGHLFPSPLFLKTGKQVVGGFSLQKFWPLPLVGLWAMAIPDAVAQSTVAVQMPEWWPIFASKTPVATGQTLMFVLLPIVAGLGYGDLAVSTHPRGKSKRSSLNLAVYSLLLVGAAFLCLYLPVITIPAALFATFGHELLISLGNRKEFAGTAFFVPPRQGVRVLDIFPNSAAAAARLVPGDTILSVNGFTVEDYRSFYSLIQTQGTEAELVVENSGQYRRVGLTPSGDTGIVLVPDGHVPAFMEVKQMSFFSALGEKVHRVTKHL